MQPVDKAAALKVTVRAVDAESGEPVEGLSIVLSRSPLSKRSFGPVGAERTDARGEASWHLDDAAQLSVELEGYSYALADEVEWTVDSFEPTEPLLIEVARRTHLVVKVLGPDGTPIDKGILDCEYTHGRALHASSRFFSPGDGGTWEAAVPPGVKIVLIAKDHDGAAAELEFECDGSARVEKTLRLKRNRPAGDRGDVRVTVLDATSKRPIPGASLKALYSVGAGGARVHSSVDAKTRGSGVALLRRVLVGTRSINVTADDYFRGSADVEVAKDRTTAVTIHLEPSLSIRGKIEGRPGAWVSARRASEEKARYEVESDAGTFVLRGLEDGRYVVWAYGPRFGERVEIPDVAAGTRDLCVRFPPAGDVRIRCTDSDGRPVEEVTLRAARRSSLRYREEQTNPEGVFVLRQVPAGRRDFWVDRSGYRELGPFAVSVEPGKTATLDARFGAPLPVLHITVKDPDGRAVRDCPLSVYTPKGHFLIWGERRLRGPSPNRTGSDGRYRVPVDFHGEVEVVLHECGSHKTAPGFAKKRVELPRTGDAVVRFAVTPALRVWNLADQSPHYKAGLRDDDVILEWGGRRLRERRSLPNRWRAPVQLQVLRNGATRRIELAAGSLDFYAKRVLLAPR